MIIPLVVILSSLVYVCTGAPYDVSLLDMGRSYDNSQSGAFAVSFNSNGDAAVLGGFASKSFKSNLIVNNNYQVLIEWYTGKGGYPICTAEVGGTGHEMLSSIAVDKKHNTFATGTSNSTYNGIAAAGDDVFIAKFRSCVGTAVFYSQFGGSGDDYAAAVAVDSTGSFFFVVGSTNSPTLNGVSRVGTVDGFVTKIDAATGSIDRQFNFGCATCITNFNATAFDSAGNLWVTGSVNTFGAAYYDHSPIGDADMIIQKFDASTGSFLSVDLVGGSLSDVGTGIVIDTKDNVYTVGISYSTTVDGQHSNKYDSANILVVKYNSAGVKQWTKLYGGAGDDEVRGITVDSTQGLLYLTGNTNSPIFYGNMNPDTVINPFLLVLNTITGAIEHSVIYPSTSNSYGRAIATNGISTYIVGTAHNDLLYKKVYGTGTFLLELQGHTRAPVYKRPCLEWTLGDFGQTCTETCEEFSLKCKDAYFADIVTQEAFYTMVASTMSLRTRDAIGTAENFCSQGITTTMPVDVPAAFSFLRSPDRNVPWRTTCSYPTSAARATCDAPVIGNMARRFCPCVNNNCDGGWFLGYAGDSCDTTCANVDGVCEAAPLATIVDEASFSKMVASATSLDTNELVLPRYSDKGFCTEGTNMFSFASAPAAITLITSVGKQTMCTYPTAENPLDDACDKSFTEWPAQRFCHCKMNFGKENKSKRD